jgi:transcriptional regulator with XRE-family HTH domain
MSGWSDGSIGERVRFYRGARPQAAVAGLAAISVDYLSLIERGQRTPTVATLHRIAGVLRVPVTVLLGRPAVASGPGGHPATPAIQRALVRAHAPDAAVDPGELRRRLDRVWETWESSRSRFGETGPVLPDLIARVEAAAKGLRTPSEAEMRRGVLRTRADLYFLLRAFLRQVGRGDLSLLAADRGARAAEDADDPVRMAVARWNLAHALLADDELEAAGEVALKAADALSREVERGVPRFAAMYGALYLVAAVADVRGGETRAARGRLEEARATAQKVGEHSLWGTWFGPINAGHHAVSVEMEAGRPDDALRLAAAVPISRSGSIERRTRFLLEVARCHEQRREDRAALAHVLRAERESPEDVRQSALSRDLVRTLLRRGRSSRLAEARSLADRIGIEP